MRTLHSIFALLPLSWALTQPAMLSASPTQHHLAPTSSLSPTALAASPDGRTLYIACATAAQVIVFDAATRTIRDRIATPPAPSGLTLSSDGARLYVTCSGPRSPVCVVNTANHKIEATVPAGHTAQAPLLSPDGRTLFVCCRFNNCIQAIDLAQGRVTRTFPVAREPVAAALTADGRFLLVANHLQAGRADVDEVAAAVTVLDLMADGAAREIALPNGASLLRDLVISPDGRYAVVTHTLARFHLPTTQVDRGWINSSAASLIDLTTLQRLNTVLLDNIDAGAANPWAAAWTRDGRFLCVTHAGTHELSVIDFPSLLAKLSRLATASAGQTASDDLAASQNPDDVPNDLSFLVGLRRRVRLARPDQGPRALLLADTHAWLANYFSDTLSLVDLTNPSAPAESVPLGPSPAITVARRGEALFNDATLCFQGWQSCASCHSSDARVDGMNWDNLNDGIGNPKNAKSLLLAHATPPAMWLGVRSNAHAAVRAGIRNSLFTIQPEEHAAALDTYLASLQPLPSPHLADGQLSPAARRGQALFRDPDVGCARCHDGPHYTDQKFHHVGTAGKFDQPAHRFDTPTLIEVWRTAPYLHDGRARSLHEVFTVFNPKDQHGHTSHLTRPQLDDLLAFVLSL